MTDATPLETVEDTQLDPSVEELPSEGNLSIATEKLPHRHRRILASISIPCSVEQVWGILTDYENLSSFIPNLTVSRRLETDGSRTLLEQVGSQCFLNIQFCARVVLDMAEQFPHCIGFSMVEGDFKSFEGAWKLEQAEDAEQGTRLNYEITICPPRAIPAVLIERHLRHDLTQNLQAIRNYAIAANGAA
ncbi:SRPBCC family protein [Leptolyngbya iicbica]|uniref:Cyclase n=2 Tax=Cyanophyceae TaxID=3028117 RepID=A0A4Q7EFT4_9CYAN|nr:SRPBCC family protein [Leptolyngbya sp. LK]RZM81896.1 cyclase [Leptolyngbya sp. LK]